MLSQFSALPNLPRFSASEGGLARRTNGWLKASLSRRTFFSPRPGHMVNSSGVAEAILLSDWLVGVSARAKRAGEDDGRQSWWRG